MTRDNATEIGNKVLVDFADECLIQNRSIHSSTGSSNWSSYDSSEFDSFDSESRSQKLEINHDSSGNSSFTNETSETFDDLDSSDGSIDSIDDEMIGGVDFFKSKGNQYDNLVGAQTMNILGVTSETLSFNTVYALKNKNEHFVEKNVFNKKSHPKLNGETYTLFYTNLYITI